MEISHQQFEPPRQAQKSSLFFVEIGIFEMVFVGVLLVVIFGLLNYLNILHLEKPFPFLSFLPHIPEIATNKASLVTIPDVPEKRSSDREELISFISANLKPSALPFKNLKSLSVGYATASAFLYWTPIGQFKPTNISQAKVTYLPRTKIIQNETIILYFTPPQSFTLNSLTTQSTLQQYATFPLLSEWNCTSTFCESFNLISSLKKGYGIVETSENAWALFICQIPKESNLFYSTKSCFDLNIFK